MIGISLEEAGCLLLGLLVAVLCLALPAWLFWSGLGAAFFVAAVGTWMEEHGWF